MHFVPKHVIFFPKFLLAPPKNSVLAACLSFTTYGGGLHTVLFNAERQAEKQRILVFMIFGLAGPGIEP